MLPSRRRARDAFSINHVIRELESFATTIQQSHSSRSTLEFATVHLSNSIHEKMVNFSTGCLGFGRMGPNRELKFALEKHWRGDIDAAALVTVANQVEDLSWDMQSDAGIEKITVGDFCLYDNVLQWAEWLGIIPSRFTGTDPGMSRMFAMARGVDGAPALSTLLIVV